MTFQGSDFRLDWIFFCLVVAERLTPIIIIFVFVMDSDDQPRLLQMTSAIICKEHLRRVRDKTLARRPLIISARLMTSSGIRIRNRVRIIFSRLRCSFMVWVKFSPKNVCMNSVRASIIWALVVQRLTESGLDLEVLGLILAASWLSVWIKSVKNINFRSSDCDLEVSRVS